MKSSEILREAARLVEAHEETDDYMKWPKFGCFAIFAAKFGLHLPWYMADEDTRGIEAEMRHFRQTSPGSARGPNGWFGNDSGHRIIALCLAAAIAESEGD